MQFSLISQTCKRQSFFLLKFSIKYTTVFVGYNMVLLHEQINVLLFNLCFRKKHGSYTWACIELKMSSFYF